MHLPLGWDLGRTGHLYPLVPEHSDGTSPPEDGERGTPGWVSGTGAEADGRGRAQEHRGMCIPGHHKGVPVNRRLAEMVFWLRSNQFGFITCKIKQFKSPNLNFLIDQMRITDNTWLAFGIRINAHKCLPVGSYSFGFLCITFISKVFAMIPYQPHTKKPLTTSGGQRKRMYQCLVPPNSLPLRLWLCGRGKCFWFFNYSSFKYPESSNPVA